LKYREILRDRTFIEEMKADILRRAEAISSNEEEGEPEPDLLTSKGKGQKPSLGMDIGPDEDDEIPVPLASPEMEDEDDEDDEEEEEELQTPEAIVELAYLRDPKLLDRDAATRRSKARADLKAQTGMLQYNL
jgi:activating signal cointegrator complex subunit 2